MAKQTFEQAIQQLEKIVQELESGDLPLEQAMKKFEDGINSVAGIFSQRFKVYPQGERGRCRHRRATCRRKLENHLRGGHSHRLPDSDVGRGGDGTLASGHPLRRRSRCG